MTMIKSHCAVAALLAGAAFTAPAVACDNKHFAIIEPFVGTWQEFTIKDESRIPIGTLSTEAHRETCTIAQSFTSEDSDFTFRSFGYFEPTSSMWVETYVFSTGSVTQYHWLVDNDDIILRRVRGTTSLDFVHQLRLVEVTGDSYKVIEQRSADGGKSWENTETTLAMRRK